MCGFLGGDCHFIIVVAVVDLPLLKGAIPAGVVTTYAGFTTPGGLRNTAKFVHCPCLGRSAEAGKKGLWLANWKEGFLPSFHVALASKLA